MDPNKLKNIVEAALLAAGRPLNVEQLQALFADIERPDRAELKAAVEALEADYQDRPIRVIEVASGWRIQVREEMSAWLSRLWQDRPARYSRALLETLALIAYRQPITRGEIEDIRGVSVSSNIMRTLVERGWVRIVGHRDVPGRPGMYATTREFLDYFGLKKLEDLPPLAEIRDLDSISVEFDLGLMELPPVSLPEEAGEHEETTDADDPQNAVQA
jgi:segregation and condensation protein B